MRLDMRRSDCLIPDEGSTTRIQHPPYQLVDFVFIYWRMLFQPNP